MGCSLDLFLNSSNIDQEFICSICQDVLEDPMLIEACEHIFCNPCLTEWCSSSDTCPLDREPIVGAVKSPYRAFVNVLYRFKLRCKFSEHGCGSIIELGNMQQHHSNCEHNPELMRPCAGGCGAIISGAQMSNHNCVTFLKAEVEKRDVKNIQLEIELTNLKKENSILKEVLETTLLHSNQLNPRNLTLLPSSNPRVFLTIRLDGVELGRIIIELRSDVVPKTAENFRVLCTGEKGFGYKGTTLYNSLPGIGVCGVDCLRSSNGKNIGRKFIYGPDFSHENYILKHNVRGILSMTNTGLYTTNCRFIITFKAVPEYDGNLVAFGLVVEGLDILQQIEKLGKLYYTERILISDCGQLNN